MTKTPTATTEAFFEILERIPVGRDFSINDVRHRLDEAQIPANARAGLFGSAVNLGICQPLVVHVAGRDVPVQIPSTGPSAHGALVRVYRRTVAQS